MAGLGMLGYIGFARESSGGVPLAPSSGNYFQAISESLTENYNFFEPVNIFGSIAEPDDQRGTIGVEGEIVAPFHPVWGAHFLGMALGRATSVTSINANLQTHIFRPPATSQWDSRFALQPYTIEIGRDAGSAQQYTGCLARTISFETAPNQELRATLGIIGIGGTNKAATTPTYPGSPVEMFAFDQASLSLNGVANANIESFSFTIDNNLEPVYTLRDNAYAWKIRRNNSVMANFSLSMEFDSITELQRFRDQTEFPLRIAFTRAASFMVVFNIPRAVYRAFPLGTSGRGRNVIQVDGKARYHAGSATSFQIELTTTVASGAV